MDPVLLLEVVIDDFMALAVYIGVNEIEHCNEASILYHILLEITL